MVDGTVYVDGSRLDGEASLAGLCARHGWAIAIFDSTGTLQASAKGRPPAWSSGIHGAELWGLLMATQAASPWASIRVDCLSVQQGAQRGGAWAAAPDRRLARAWAPIAAALDEDSERVIWMPAHCTESQVGVKQLSNGDFLSAVDLQANAVVDQLAKEAAREDRLPIQQRKVVSDLSDTVAAVATWIGQITHIAGNFPNPAWSGAGPHRTLRDSEGMRSKAAATGIGARDRACVPQTASRNGPVAGGVPGAQQLHDLSHNSQWAALHQRVVAKEHANLDAPQRSSGESTVDSALPTMIAVQTPASQSRCLRSRRGPPSQFAQMLPQRWRTAAGQMDGGSRQDSTCNEITGGQKDHRRPVEAAVQLSAAAAVETVAVAVGSPAPGVCDADRNNNTSSSSAGRSSMAVSFGSGCPEGEEESALQELLELQQCGLSVCLPRAKSEVLQSGATAVSPSLVFEATPASFIPQSDTSPRHSQSETEAAIKDLLELQMEGMRVVMP